MKREEVEKYIADLVLPLLEGTGISLSDVEYVREKDWYLRVFIDKPEGIEIEVSSPGLDRPLKKDRDLEACYGKKVDITFFAPYEGNKMLTGILTGHDTTAVQLKVISKGKEAKEPVFLERKLIAVIKPHIDF